MNKVGQSQSADRRFIYCGKTLILEFKRLEVEEADLPDIILKRAELISIYPYVMQTHTKL